MNANSSSQTTIVQGTLVASTTSAFITALYGIAKGKGRLTPLLAGSAAFNTAIAAVLFFAVREYTVSPVLLSLSGADVTQNAQIETSTATPLSWRHLRSQKVLDTTASGFLTGGVLSALKNGRRAAIPGAVTAAVFCAILQLGYNEASVARIKYILRRAEPAIVVPLEHSHSMMDKFVGNLGFSRISDEQYLSAMKKTRDGYLERIRELEEQHTQAEEPIIEESSLP